MANKEKRKLRHQRNQQKDITYKKTAWESGKLIEENHNDKPYTKEYTEELGQRLADRIQIDQSVSNFRKYKNKIKELILHWSPGCEKSETYNYLKGRLENYWDNENY